MLRLMLDHHPAIDCFSEFEYVVDYLPEEGGFPAIDDYRTALENDRVFCRKDSRFAIEEGCGYPEIARGFLRQVRERKGAGRGRRRDGPPPLRPPAADLAGGAVRPPDPRRPRRGPLDDRHGLGGQRLDRRRPLARGRTALGAAPGAARARPLRRDPIRGRHHRPAGRARADLRFLGLAYDPAMLRYAEDSSYEAPDPSLTYQWRRKLTEREVRLVEARIGPMLEARGYERSGLPPLEVDAAERARLRRQDYWSRVRHRVRGWAPCCSPPTTSPVASARRPCGGSSATASSGDGRPGEVTDRPTRPGPAAPGRPPEPSRSWPRPNAQHDRSPMSPATWASPTSTSSPTAATRPRSGSRPSRPPRSRRSPGKLILVSAITPTPAGEGKTTTSIGLAQGLRRIGEDACLALRQPSMGPVFGRKGGATGGGLEQGRAVGRHQPPVHRRLPRDHRRPQPAGRGDRQPPPLRRVGRRPAPGPLEAGDGHERPGPAADRRRPRRADAGGPAGGELRHHGGQRGHGDPLPRRVPRRPPRAARPHPDRLSTAIGEPVLAAHGRRHRGDGGDPQRGDPAEPRAVDRGGPGLRPRRAVRQHRPRLQLGPGDPDGAGPRRLRRSPRPASPSTSAPRSSSTSSADPPA